MQIDKVVDINTKEEMSKNLRALYDQKSEGAKVRSRIKWFEEGEKSSTSKYFHDLERRNGKEKLWDRILDKDGNMLEDRQDILKRQKQFYVELFAEEECDDNMTEQFLNEFHVKVPVELKEMLNKELRKEEFDKIVKSLKKNKSPGPDGIISEFYIEY